MYSAQRLGCSAGSWPVLGSGRGKGQAPSPAPTACKPGARRGSGVGAAGRGQSGGARGGVRRVRCLPRKKARRLVRLALVRKARLWHGSPKGGRLDSRQCNAGACAGLYQPGGAPSPHPAPLSLRGGLGSAGGELASNEWLHPEHCIPGPASPGEHPGKSGRQDLHPASAPSIICSRPLTHSLPPAPAPRGEVVQQRWRVTPQDAQAMFGGADGGQLVALKRMAFFSRK